jgi:CTP synthase (UTP-ammonia lyase)
MTKYILVSGGVVSGIGKGVIGTPAPSIPFQVLLNISGTISLIDWLASQDARLESHSHQD